MLLHVSFVPACGLHRVVAWEAESIYCLDLSNSLWMLVKTHSWQNVIQRPVTRTIDVRRGIYSLE